MISSDFHWSDAVRLDLVPGVQSPGSARTLARVLLALGGATAVALVTVPWMQTAVGTGRVIAFAPLERQQFVKAPIEGRPTTWHVREGSHVDEGDIIVELTDNDPDIVQRLEMEAAAVRNRVTAAQDRVRAQEERIRSLAKSRDAAIAAANQRVDMARQRVVSAQQSLEAAQAGQKVAQLNFDRQKALAGQGLAAIRTLELAELDERRASTEVESATARLRAAEEEVIAFQQDQLRTADDTLASIRSAENDLNSARDAIESARAELARLEVRQARQGTMVVTAPRAGTVLRLVSAPGEFVKSGDNLAVLVPDTEQRAVEIWIDGNDVPLVTEGREVRLQFEGWPALQFSGWPSVAVGTFGGRVSLVDSTDDGTGRFRLLVTPDADEPWPAGASLRQGQRANAWILLSEVSLGFELWRQFNGFPPAILPGKDGGALPSKK